MTMRHACLFAPVGLLALSLSAVGHAGTSVVTSPAEYLQLCQRVGAVTGRSIQGIRSTLPELRGKYVEVCGKILGEAHPAGPKPETVSVYLQSGDDSCMLPCPPDIPEVRPGRCVRMLVRLATDPRDISDCKLAGIIEHPGLGEDGAPFTGDGGKRLEIGEAARGVRDRAPEPASKTSTPQNTLPLPGAPGQPLGAQPTSALPPGAALPPEMRALQTLSGSTRTQPAPAGPSVTAAAQPNLQFITQKQSAERMVQVWVQWVRSINSGLTPEMADLMVRWVIYHSAVKGVDHRLMFAVIRYESEFEPRCLSHAGAMGLCQLMPCNVRDYGIKDPWDIAENIRGGVSELAGYLQKYTGRSNYEQTVLALACYNAGPGAVARYGGVPPYGETQSYVRKVPQLFADLVKRGYP